MTKKVLLILLLVTVAVFNIFSYKSVNWIGMKAQIEMKNENYLICYQKDFTINNNLFLWLQVNSGISLNIEKDIQQISDDYYYFRDRDIRGCLIAVSPGISYKVMNRDVLDLYLFALTGFNHLFYLSEYKNDVNNYINIESGIAVNYRNFRMQVNGTVRMPHYDLGLGMSILISM